MSLSFVNAIDFCFGHASVMGRPQICLCAPVQGAIGVYERQEIFMKIMIAAALLATTICTPVWAAEFKLPSKIDAVTVFPQGADVVRDVAIDVPAGEHGIVLADLPQNVDAQSIRVEGLSAGNLIVGSIDTRSKFQGDSDDQRRAGIEKQINELSFERQALDLTLSDLNQQRTILLSLADKQLVPQTTTETVKAIDAAQLGGLLDLVGQKLSALSAAVLTAQKRQRDIDETSAKLSAQLDEIPSPEEYRTEVVVNIEAAEALKGSLRVSYRVQEASWSPFYDARLTIGDGKAKPSVELVHRAEVTQSTGERWDGVELTLSTARTNGMTAAPDAVGWEISKVDTIAQQELVMPAPAPMEDATGGAVAKSASNAADMQKPMVRSVQRQAVIENVGFQATYKIAGRVAIDNAGQSKKVRITSGQHEATLQAVVVPRVDLTAYLTANFKIAGTGPQLPGVVNLYRDGVFVGQGNLPLLNPTESADLGFGADDLVKVSRAEVNRVTGEEGFISSSNVEVRAWDVAVKNLHSIAMPVRVIDRVPFTASKEIEIAEAPGMTEPSVRDLDKKRGVLAWDFKLEPQGENTVKTGYKVTWPEGMRVSVVE
jgi:uncharacterized protein (TIGR02231 family)